MTSTRQSVQLPKAGSATDGGQLEGRARPFSGRAPRGAGSKSGGFRLPGPNESALVRLERHPSLTERVFRKLRDAIVIGELAPSGVVSIEELAGMLGVSRTPVREALPALQQLGLIVQSDTGGLQVAPLDATYIWEVYAVRSALESLAAEVVAPILTDEDLADLRKSALPPSPRPDGDYSEMFGPDLGLHDFIRQRCPLRFLNNLIDSVQVHRSRLLDLEHSASGSYRKASYAEHLGIVATLERRDGKAARQLMQQHLDRIGDEVAALIEQRRRDQSK